MPRSAFYCAANAVHFPGAVALLNSLRLVGHGEPFFVLDCGLEARQRELLAPYATLLSAPSAAKPHLLKCAAPLLRPASVMVLLDADLILTRPLTELLVQAAGGKIVAFADAVSGRRFHPEWSELLGLGPVRPGPYLNTGLLVLPKRPGLALLQLVQQRGVHVDAGRSFLADGAVPSYPLYYLDQDVWNAVLAASSESAQIVALDHRLAPHPPFPGLGVADERTLRCRYDDGAEPFALHHVGRKPWLHATRRSIYARLLARLLLAPDLTVRLEPEQVPLRLRSGALAALDRQRADLQARLRAQRGRLGLRRRLSRPGPP